MSDFQPAADPKNEFLKEQRLFGSYGPPKTHFYSMCDFGEKCKGEYAYFLKKLANFYKNSVCPS